MTGLTNKLTATAGRVATETAAQAGHSAAARASFSPSTIAALEEARFQELPFMAVRANVAGLIAADPASAGLSPAVLARIADEVLGLKGVAQTVNGALGSLPRQVSPQTVSRLTTQLEQELPDAAVRMNLLDTLRADNAFFDFSESKLTGVVNQLMTLDTVATVLGRAVGG